MLQYHKHWSQTTGHPLQPEYDDTLASSSKVRISQAEVPDEIEVKFVLEGSHVWKARTREEWDCTSINLKMMRFDLTTIVK